MLQYCIVNEISMIDGNVNYTPIGYLTDMNDCDLINNKYESTFQAWVNDNLEGLRDGSVNINTFFDVTPKVWSANQTTTSIEGSGLNEITDITPYI